MENQVHIKELRSLGGGWHTSTVTLNTEQDLNLLLHRATGVIELYLNDAKIIDRGTILTEYYNDKQAVMEHLGIISG